MSKLKFICALVVFSILFSLTGNSVTSAAVTTQANVAIISTTEKKSIPRLH
ncbi:MAG: hypothetical protein J6A88_09035 [Oscillospiraceae bacterium]|nr:hypothetical protein [Oscillospiraceae bacterium]